MDRPLTPSEKETYTQKNPPRHAGNSMRLSYRFLGTMGLFLIFCVVYMIFNGGEVQTPKLSRHESRGFAPDPKMFSEPIIQVYAARTWGAKGNFAVHTWLAYKETDAIAYEIVQVIGWRQRGNGPVVFQDTGVADKTWHGQEPHLLLDIRGNDAHELIPKVKNAIASYPWSNEYVVYPGPNSNTFISWIGQQVPELQMDLPSTAIGKDWRPIDQSFRRSTSGTGVNASFWGMLGLQVGVVEGIEINILGLHVEFDLMDLKVGLPLVGSISIWWALFFFTCRYILSIILRRKHLKYIHISHMKY